MKRPFFFLPFILLIGSFFIFTGIWKNDLMGFFYNPLDWWRNSEKINELKFENLALKAKIDALSNKIAPFQSSSFETKIFSSYPFNNKNLLSVNAGKKQGIKELMPVTIGGHILVGQIIKVFKNYSLVRTIFSPDWEIPVRIGDKKVPALLIGGPELKLTMIVNDKPIFDGQLIFAAQKDLPYGLKIGEITSVKSDSATRVFKEANVKLDYDINDLTEVSILLWTAD